MNKDVKTEKLIAEAQREQANKEIPQPCSDCPILSDPEPDWLAGLSSDEYAKICHSDAEVECHVHPGSRCAGLAIYRTIHVSPNPPEHEQPTDKTKVVLNVMEFLAHLKQLTGL